MADLPERMYAGNRWPDPEFEREEALYHRCTINGTELEEIGTPRRRLKPSYLRFPDFSINRGK